MRNAGLEEAQAGFKIAGRNLNNLRYADDTTLMAESVEELKSLLMKVKEESANVAFSPNIPDWFLNVLEGKKMVRTRYSFSSVQFSCSVMSDSLRSHDCSTPGFPVHHQLLEFTQTHVHRVGDAIQPSHPLSSPSPPALNLSQHQGLFQWVNSSHEVAKVLEFQLQHQSLQWTAITDLC